MGYINTRSVPLSIAVFLATDDYDHNPDPNTISATTLIKPLKQLILGSRADTENIGVDLKSMLASRIGQAIHKGVEDSWEKNHKPAMKALGYPEAVINQLVVNPNEVKDGQIPVYLEQRGKKKVGKWTVTGKFDFVGDGRVEDVKTTSVFTAIHATKDQDYILQGSIYRWLNPTLITDDVMAIQWIFTDWQRAKSLSDPNYPKDRHMEKLFELMSVTETDKWVRNKLRLIEQYWDSPEDQIPECTSEDLWQSDPTWKYYKDPLQQQRSTKNFNTKIEAYRRLHADGGKGYVKEVAGEAKACKYCPGFSECSQKDRLIKTGALKL